MNNIQQHDHQHQQELHVIPQGGDDRALALSVEAFLRSLVGKNRSPGTIRAYRTDLGQFVAWLGETNGVLTHPGQITKVDVSAFLSYVGGCGVSGVSRARKLAAIREWFRFLVLYDVITRSPADGIVTPKREQRLRSYLRPDEYHQLLSLAGANPRDYAILQVFLQTGVRVSELCALRLDDIDVTGRMLRIRGGKGMVDREIELEKKGIQAVRRWLEVRPKVLDDHLFLNYQGELISDRGVRKLVAKYRQASAQPKSKRATPHTLRHTFGSIKAQQGVNLRQVQQWLGHKSLATTQLYTHLDRQSGHKAMEATSL